VGRGLSQQSKDLISRAYRVLEEEHPSNVRRACYAMFGNRAGEWTQKMGGLLTRARKDGTIPWSWIDDESRPKRVPYVVEGNDQLDENLGLIPSYDPWHSQNVRVEVWSEKSVGGTLAPVLDEYLVPFQVHHGFTSTTVARKAAQSARRGLSKLVIFHVGDHDASGLYISEVDIPKRLREYGAIDFEVRRLAVTRADVKELWQFRDPVKEADSRTAWYTKTTGLKFGVELEAMSSNVLRERVRTAIQSCITDVAAWNRVMHASSVVSESWREYAANWPRPAVPIPGLDPR
jgi:hypothetical protein